MSNLKAEYGAMELRDEQIHLDLQSYKGKAYIDAIKVIDIASVMILSKDKIGQLGKSSEGIANDVIVRHLTGEVEYITRKQLALQYRLLTGKPIILLKIKANKWFNVKRQCNINYKVMLVPPGFINHYKGKVINGRAYAVIPSSQNNDEELNTSNVHIISANKFRKLFVIPDNELIEHSRKRAELMQNKGKESFSIKSYIKYRLSEYNKENGITKKEKPKAQLEKEYLPKEKTLVTKPIQNNINIKSQINKSQQNQNADSKYRFKAIARILNINNVLVGFILIDRNGKKYTKGLAEVSTIASKKLIANLSLVTNTDNTKKFLRGNGIRIEDLPIVVK